MKLWARLLITKLMLAAVLFVGFVCRSCAEERYTPIVDETIGSVAKITTVYLVREGRKKYTVQTDFGAGVVISTNGHILTCEHVVSESPMLIDVQFPGDLSKHFQAVVLRRSFKYDLALLKIATTTVPVPLSRVNPRAGDEVIVIGHPEGHWWSVTKGVVSGMNRDGIITNLLQMDAAVNPGNSGGPVFNTKGEVIGLAESLQLGNSLGFAVPITSIREFLEVFRGLEAAL